MGPHATYDGADVQYRRAKLDAGLFKARYGWHDFLTRSKESIDDGDERPRVKIIVKCDVEGSKDAILSCLETYNDSTVRLQVLNAAVGEVTKEDVEFGSNFIWECCILMSGIMHTYQEFKEQIRGT